LKKGTTRYKLRKKFLYGLYLFFIVFLLLEIALRIYNPFHLRLKGDKIVLPVNRRDIIRNTINPKLDSIIVNTRNSIGFRGPDPVGGSAHLTIITVGGSTTECHFLSDDKTWPQLLGRAIADSFNHTWLNNAGLDGHSSFGHQVLLNDYLVRIKPKVVLFLTGINDIGNDQPTFHDKLNIKGAYPDLKHYLFENSEVLNVALNLVRGWRAQKFNNTTDHMLQLAPGKNEVIPEAVIAKQMDAQQPYLASFRKREMQLIDTCRRYGIMPVFITQADQFGYGTDTITQANLELFSMSPGKNGKLEWQILEMYNDVTRQICKEMGADCIDLARKMPKNSLYFYDNVHFTNAGAAKTAAIVYDDLAPVLRKHFPQYSK
jgi:lysophospholipase L1-like esterase